MSTDYAAPAPAPADDAYDGLWHLAAIGVVELDPDDASPSPRVLRTVWDAIAGAGASRPARIALVDVGVGDLHPALGRVLASEALDLATHPAGARYEPDASEDEATTPAASRSFFADIPAHAVRLAGLTQAQQARLGDILAQLAETPGVYRRTAFFDRALPAHGTAAAGLLVGDPGFARPRDDAIAYAGVDPFSDLIAIRTAFDADPQALIAALIYARARGADVIVIPREFPDPLLAPMAPLSDAGADQTEAARKADALHGRGRDDDWELLRALVVAISHHVPIVAAAGNSGEGQLIYPASLAAIEGSGVVAVGAVNAFGYRAGYSNGGPVTVHAPSDDAEVLDREQARLDPLGATLDPGLRGAGAAVRVTFSRRTIVTTDLPGDWGYARAQAPFPGTANGGGLYGAFGGTSAATAIVGGVVALMARAAAATGGSLDGPTAKRHLTQTARDAFHVAPVLPQGAQDAKAGSVALVGRTIVDARAAVAAVLGAREPSRAGSDTRPNPEGART